MGWRPYLNWSERGGALALLDRLSAGWRAWIILFVLTLSAAAPGVFNLPALDRDESRFAQSSKQFLETGDYIVLRYQDEFRNKKPAGIHWLQAGATAVLGDGDRLAIWTYRVPSWIGAALASVAVFWAGLVLVGRRASFLGAALFGTTLLLTSEAHISKTDGVLVFLTAWGLGALARLYMRRDAAKSMALLFWFVMGASFLIKGPVTLMVAAYAGLGVWIWARAAEQEAGTWWRPLTWWPGPVIFLAMVLPWFIWIQLATDGQYIQGAVGKDLKDKFAGASEGHAGWPLYHLTHIPAWFFPATLLLIPGVAALWGTLFTAATPGRIWSGSVTRMVLGLAAVTALLSWLLPGEIGNGLPSAFPALLLAGVWISARRVGPPQGLRNGGPVPDDIRALRFLAAWAVLTTLFFELMPTRLSHYILPAYPAYALICGWVALELVRGRRLVWSGGISLALFLLGGGALILASSPLAVHLVQTEAAGDFRTAMLDDVLAQWAEATPALPLWLWSLGGAVLFGAALAFATGRILLAVAAGILSSMFLGWHIRTYFLPSQFWVQPTERARQALDQLCGVPGTICRAGQRPPDRILALGYAEPSYVMTLGTQNLHPPETPLSLPPLATEVIVYLVNLEDPEGPDARAHLLEEAAEFGYCVTESRSVYALNYSNGDPVHFRALRFDPAPCSAQT